MIDFLENLESKLQRQEKVLSEELLRNERLDAEVQEYLAEYNVSEEQITQFISQKENFSEENWQDLRKVKDELENKLQIHLDTIAKPLRLKKAYKERSMMHHWIPMR